MGATVHVVGAGLAGLAAAVALVAAGRRVRLYEAAGQAGGRCRSFHDAQLDRLIDNGNHLLFSGNTAVETYLAAIGGADGLVGPERAAFEFLDLANGERWTVRPGAGAVPWWIWAPGRRVPGTVAGDYLRAWRLARAGPQTTVAECLGTTGPAYRRFWEPLTVAVLNTAAADGAARLLWPVLRETLGRGEAACRPRMARHGLSPCFVDPALDWLARRGATIETNRRLRAIDGEACVRGLGFVGATVDLADGDAVVLAVPPDAAAALLPGLVVPTRSNPIVNGHFRLDGAPAGSAILGLIGGLSQWLFVRGGIASVTVSAAADIVDLPADAIARRMWPEVAQALGRDAGVLPPYRIVKERRATFAQTPAQTARRPGVRTAWRNLLLAGDWTDTGLPATIESAVRSGFDAAQRILEMQPEAHAT